MRVECDIRVFIVKIAALYKRLQLCVCPNSWSVRVSLHKSRANQIGLYSTLVTEQRGTAAR